MSATTIAFHASGGTVRGLGHIRRCLTLAATLKDRGVESRFLIDGDQSAVELVVSEGFPASAIAHKSVTEAIDHDRSYGARIAVVDSYDVNDGDFDALRVCGWTVVAIDDVAERRLPVQMVVNGTVGATREWYSQASSVEPPSRFLLGPSYVLLRREFGLGGVNSDARDIERVLVTVGGGDTQNLTPKLIEWTLAELPGVAIDVVLGPFFHNVSDVEQAACRGRSGQVSLWTEPDCIRDLMAAADVALCGGGQTTYELAAVGTPALAVRCASNQSRNLEGFAAAGTLLIAGDADDPALHHRLRQHLRLLAENAERRAAMRAAGRRIVDGHGADRVAAAIMNLLPTA